MKYIEAAKPREFEPVFNAEASTYTYPCGCTFKVDATRPTVNGHLPIIIDRKYNEQCSAVWDLFAEGLTTGVFQLESPLGKRYAAKLKPESIEHLAALVALLRPGVLKAKDENGVNMADLFCYRKNGIDKVEYPIEAIREILEETYGILIFQETLLKLVAILAHFDKFEADALRAAVGKKKMDKIFELGNLFVDRCEQVGIITREQAVEMYENIKKAGSYMFNKAHSVSYAINAFETAYLKVHLPVYFFAAYLEYAGDKQDPVKEIRKLMRDAKRFDVQVLTPRFVDLEPRFTSDNVKVRFGLTSVKGVGEKAVAKIANALDREVLMTWDWYRFLTQGSALCGIGHLRNIILAGGMGEYPLARQRMVAELQAWNDLTEREQGEVLKLGEPLYKTVPDYEEQIQDVEVPEYDKQEMKEYRAALKTYKEARKDYERMCADILNNEEYQAESGDQYDLPDYPDKPDVAEPAHPDPIGTVMKPKKVKVQVGEHRDLVDEARPASTLEEALQGLLDRPGCLSKARRPKVESALSLLRNPPFPLVDEPYRIEKDETELLGVPITATIMDGVDASIADTTVLEYLEGKDDDSMVIAGQVAEFFEREVRNGENRGRKMATLAFADDTGTLEDCVVFPESWEAHASLLMRPAAAVAIEGVRSRRDGKTFIINDAWSLA